jgi:hypothetical protein
MNETKSHQREETHPTRKNASVDATNQIYGPQGVYHQEPAMAPGNFIQAAGVNVRLSNTPLTIQAAPVRNQKIFHWDKNEEYFGSD